MQIIIFALGILSWFLAFRRFPITGIFFYGVFAHIVFSVFFIYTWSTVFGVLPQPNFVSFLNVILAFLSSHYLGAYSHRITKQHYSFIMIGVFIPFLIAFSLNILVSSQSHIFYIPIVGSNDDTATHLGMTIMTTKENKPLFENRILESLIEKGVEYQNARHYPPSIYMYTTYIYQTISANMSSQSLNLLLMVNIYSVVSFLTYLLFLFSIIDAGLSLLRSISIWAVVPIVVFAIFFVAGEYFMILFRMSYLTQLLGSSFLIIFFRNLLSEGEGDIYFPGRNIITSLSLLGIGLSYYLFLPIAIAGLLYTTLFTSGERVRLDVIKQKLFSHWYIFLIATVSLVPFLKYLRSYDLVDQITIPGINLLTLGTIIQFCFMVVGIITIRRYILGKQYLIFLLGLLASLGLAIATTSPSMLKSGKLPYYFYKSFFTSGLFATIFALAFIATFTAQISRMVYKFGKRGMFVANTLLWLILPLLFILFLYAYPTRLIGYKGLTYLAEGKLNYYQPHILVKLLKMYDKYGDAKIAVFNPGYWGENILLFSLFENIPQIHVDGTRLKKYYFSNDPDYFMSEIVRLSKSGKEIFLFDGHNSFKPPKKQPLQK
jgi:hypothetical protein